MEPYQPELFDTEALRREAIAATPWHGVPLTYTTDYYRPEDLTAAFERFVAERGNFGCIPRSHMWHLPPDVRTGEEGHRPLVEWNEHEMWLFTADCRCGETDHTHAEGEIPDALMYQTICPGCGWHAINGSATRVAQAWHDHAMPGWRDLPIVPLEISQMVDDRKRRLKLQAWLMTHYPATWQRPGSPITTQVGVGSRSCLPHPYGGYRFIQRT